MLETIDDLRLRKYSILLVIITENIVREIKKNAAKIPIIATWFCSVRFCIFNNFNSKLILSPGGCDCTPLTANAPNIPTAATPIKSKKARNNCSNETKINRLLSFLEKIVNDLPNVEFLHFRAMLSMILISSPPN